MLVVNVIEDWRQGTISLYENMIGKKLFDVDSRITLNGDFEDENESIDDGSFMIYEICSDNTSSDSEYLVVAFLLVDKELVETSAISFSNGLEDAYAHFFERAHAAQNRGFKKERLDGKDIELKSLKKGEEKYLKMVSQYPDIFITSYEETRSFKEKELCIDMKYEVKPLHQRIQRMGGEQMAALQEEVDHILKECFICLVETTKWVSSIVFIPKKYER